MLVGGVGKFVKATARQGAEAIEMRLEVSAQCGLHIEVEQATKRLVGAIEVHPAAVGSDVIGPGLFTRAAL